MEQPLAQTIALLARTPAALNALLRELPDSLTRQNEGGDTWSAYDIIGHIVYAERTDWMPRVKIILQFGETQPFEKFDRLGRHGRAMANRSDNCWTNLSACEKKTCSNCAR
jgi:hypothetical protein